MTSTNQPGDAGHHYSEAELHNEDVAHEHSDINIRMVLAFGIGMAIVVLVAALLVKITFNTFEARAERRDPQLSPLALPPDQQPPAPQLLTNEPGGLSKFRAEEIKKLDGYGWVDERAGVARVPIEEAKKLLLQRGLPARAAAVQDPKLGTHAPAYGEASSGRTIAVPK